jgi:methylisocitrate lyase
MLLQPHPVNTAIARAAWARTIRSVSLRQVNCLMLAKSFFSDEKDRLFSHAMSSRKNLRRRRSASPGKKLRHAVRSERPLQIVGVINAYAAILAEKTGFKALYLSGAGVANASRGIPDIGFTTLEDVLTDVRRITAATSLPLLVDADTAWGNPAKTVREMIRAGAAGVHIEDQVEAKKCGHLQGKRLVSPDAMVRRLRAAVKGKQGDPRFVIMARTDAVATEGLEAGVKRACLYRDAGADMIFAEALYTLDQYRAFADAVKVPVLANITEFGKTPLFTTAELRDAGVRLALYPLSAFRAMNSAALKVFRELRARGTQTGILNLMQTRAELYAFLRYDPAKK